MLSRIVNHARGNIVSYVALFSALGGTSYAAASLAPNSISTRALRNGAVTRVKLATGSVAANNVRNHSLTAADLNVATLAKAADGAAGGAGQSGADGKRGAVGPTGPAGHDGTGTVVATAQSTGDVTAAHSSTANVPLTGGTWTQGANSLNLITGSMTVGIPAKCTGSFGNGLLIDVDGTPETFGIAPTAPASTDVTVPFEVSELMEPSSDTQHTITATAADTCSKSGEDYTISNVKLTVESFDH